MEIRWMARRTGPGLVRRWCPPRRQDTHKGDYGRVLIIGGAEGYTGAPVLAAVGALRAGAGLITAAVPRCVYPIVAGQLYGPMALPVADQDGKISCGALETILERLEGADVCVLGPGLGRSEETAAVAEAVLAACRCPLLLDADGINVLASRKDLLSQAACPLILTPHEGEFRRLTRKEEPDRVAGAMTLAQELGAVVLRKGHETVVTDGRRVYLNRTGNAGMATGGSGDVLAGVLAACLARGVPPLEAAATAAWLHGRAGDLAARELSQYAMGPMDLVEKLSQLLP